MSGSSGRCSFLAKLFSAEAGHFAYRVSTSWHGNMGCTVKNAVVCCSGANVFSGQR